VAERGGRAQTSRLHSERETTMREHTPETITEAVLEQMAGTENARLKEIMECAVRHLHAFAREVNLTPAEWLRGIAFMTRVGQLCSPARQEFILLSDTLGLSTLVNTLHERAAHGTGRADRAECFEGERDRPLGPGDRRAGPTARRRARDRLADRRRWSLRHAGGSQRGRHPRRIRNG